ncbi:protein of unknown function [Methylocaldum szegediense]|uniref:Uncharacterized protein n=1 Tax=Methylocaldum szegediense TaxID=73780 RepID=A0ABN8X970_9GAMM|nr:protein of unknown function [Methylocaldum szegediense]
MSGYGDIIRKSGEHKKEKAVTRIENLAPQGGLFLRFTDQRPISADRRNPWPNSTQDL